MSGLYAMAPTFFILWMQSGIVWDDHNIFVVRTLFGLVLGMQALLGLYVQSLVQSKNDRRKIQMPAATAPGTETTVMTVKEFDLAECTKFMGEIVNNAMMMGAIHWYFQVVQPLYFQIFLGIFRIWEWSMFRIHVLSESEEDFPLLKRPFPLPPNPLKDLMEQFMGPQQEEQPEGGSVAVVVAGGGGGGNASRVEILEDDADDDVVEDKKNK